MKTYESELIELKMKLMDAKTAADEKVKALPPVGGFDDRATPIYNEAMSVWTKGVIELKLKYQKPLSEKDEYYRKAYGI